ncbi:hypothetical protein BCR32DRAFT_288688, partial [Anaeromyces robustus]
MKIRYKSTDISFVTHRQKEFEELRDIYIEKGLTPRLATEVAEQLTTDDIDEV